MAEFGSYYNAAITPADDDVVLIADTSNGDAVEGVHAEDLPIGTATQTALDAVEGTINFGTEIALSSDDTFDKDDGRNLIVNCTADAELSPSGSFVSGFGITIFNIGTHTILFDGAHNVGPGQHAVFAYDLTNDEFVGGV